MQSTCWQNSGLLEWKRLFLMSAMSGFLFTYKVLIRQFGSWFAAGFSGVHFHCPSQRRKQCVVIRHFCSSRSLVTCPLKCHASGMSEVRLGNAAVTNDARFQCSQRTLFLSQAIRTPWTSYMGSADCRYSETQADGITSIHSVLWCRCAVCHIRDDSGIGIQHPRSVIPLSKELEIIGNSH